ncbi:transposase [Vagococcus elongatus]|uniref:transposase n=1 Tax=Vagococcus elongatus TaxID=180344 RepID=UPI003CCC809A
MVQYFMRYPRKVRLKIKYLTMDMNPSYGQLIQTVFPNEKSPWGKYSVKLLNLSSILSSKVLQLA